MAIYLSIDGDDTGSKIAKSYLENDEAGLAHTIKELGDALAKICERLRSMGFEVIFCAADGVASKGPELNIEGFLHFVNTVGKPKFTFSFGVGADLQTSYLALKYAKAVGKGLAAVCEEGNRYRIIDGGRDTY